jgi:hypothetical protein
MAHHLAFVACTSLGNLYNLIKIISVYCYSFGAIFYVIS